MRSRDLVAMGAYSPGSDLELDTALRVWPGISAYLQQGPAEAVDLPMALSQLSVLGSEIVGRG
jgi:flagellum-specific ATP synthase